MHMHTHNPCLLRGDVPGAAVDACICVRWSPAGCSQMFQAQQQMDRQLNKLERLADAGAPAEPRPKPAESGRNGGASAPEPASQPGAPEHAPAGLDLLFVDLLTCLQLNRACVSGHHNDSRSLHIFARILYCRALLLLPALLPWQSHLSALVFRSLR